MSSLLISYEFWQATPSDSKLNRLTTVHLTCPRTVAWAPRPEAGQCAQSNGSPCELIRCELEPMRLTKQEPSVRRVVRYLLHTAHPHALLHMGREVLHAWWRTAREITCSPIWNVPCNMCGARFEPVISPCTCFCMIFFYFKLRYDLHR